MGGKGDGWVGGGREQVSTSVLVKPFTDFALSHTRVISHFGTVCWKFSGLRCF